MKSLILIPTYNEKNTISNVIDEVHNYYSDDVLVVDDGSIDSTCSILSEYKKLITIRHHENLGYGQALITGFKYAIKNNYDIVVTLDADGEHDPAYIPTFLKESIYFSLVSGSRYHKDSPKITPINEDSKKINNVIQKILLKKLNFSLTDAFCGYKAYSVHKLKELELDQKDYALPMQVWVNAFFKNLTIKEIPISMNFSNHFNKKYNQFNSIEEAIKYFQNVIYQNINKFEVLTTQNLPIDSTKVLS